MIGGTLTVGDPIPVGYCCGGAMGCTCRPYGVWQVFTIVRERSVSDEIADLKAVAAKPGRQWVSMKQPPRRYRK